MTEKFYNTIDLQGERLRIARKSVKNQEDKVFIFFADRPGQLFTPTELHEGLGGEKFCRFSSIHRSLSNLTDAGWLEKTGQMRESRYNKPNHTWRLNQPEEKQMGLF